MTTESIVTVVVALLGSSVMTAVITSISNRRKTKSEAKLIDSEAAGKHSEASKTTEEVNQMLFDRMTVALDRAEGRMIDLQTQLTELREQCNDDTIRLERTINQEKNNVYKLSSKLAMLEGAFQDLPLPQWLKDTDGKMLSLNKAYEQMFLNPMGKVADDYIGNTDEDIWGPEISEKFRKNDEFARKNGKGFWIGIEPIRVKNNDISKHWWIFKYVRYVGDTPVGVAGLALPIKEADLTKLKNGNTSTD